jgi:uncharacterized peroxidase-related enzyme
LSGYLARKPDQRKGQKDMSTVGFLATPAHTPEAQQLFDEDIADEGYVMNVSRLWAYQPATLRALFGVMRQSLGSPPLSLRQRGVLVAACASALGDSYCSIAWGSKLAKEAGAEVASGVLRGDDADLSEDEHAMAEWARKVVRDPNSTTPADIEALTAVGFNDSQIFSITVFVALRLAFSTINDALGAQPDTQLFASAPAQVAAAVNYGRSASAGL